MKNKTVKILYLKKNSTVQTLQNILITKGLICKIKKIELLTPNLKDLTWDILKQFKVNFQKTSDEYIVFIPGLLEIFLKEPDLVISHSGYRSWMNSKRFRVIPPLWTPHSLAPEEKVVTWTKKPELSVGFMGNIYKDSGAAILGMYLPRFLERYFIEAWHLKYINLFLRMPIIWRLSLYLGCSVRKKAIKYLQMSSLKSDITMRNTNHKPSQKKESDEYKEHMERNTYILCPRGIENWSFRFYEALSYGKVPVLIDSDVILPSDVNWDELCIKVPYEKIEYLDVIIRNDYEGKTTSDFIYRQKKAIKTMKKLTQDFWLTELANDIVAELTE